MLISEFDYTLPPELIAQKPLARRQDSRLMVLNRRTQDIIHTRFEEFPQYLNSGEILVLNSSRVFPARVWGEIQGRKIEFLFLREEGDNTWQVLCKPGKRARPGSRVIFSPSLSGRVTHVHSDGPRSIRLEGKEVLSELEKIGYAPLPPYIKREEEDRDLRRLDLDRYQTVFARERGSVAAPTAGLHFTPEILAGIKSKGVETAFLTLHVGLATFQPVRVSRVEEHKMLEETFSLSKQAADIINRTKRERRAVAGVGTTSVRALESAARNGLARPGTRSTRLFIYPGYNFQIVDRLLTNFHLPRSSLLLLVSAFAGREFVLKAYREAVRLKYRFYSYGDCMYIL
jgi:S-adenosylmethionine:tRNA ribosyltransferase-isomerase